jgi:hypothetical protein
MGRYATHNVEFQFRVNKDLLAKVREIAAERSTSAQIILHPYLIDAMKKVIKEYGNEESK